MRAKERGRGKTMNDSVVRKSGLSRLQLSGCRGCRWQLMFEREFLSFFLSWMPNFRPSSSTHKENSILYKDDPPNNLSKTYQFASNSIREEKSTDRYPPIETVFSIWLEFNKLCQWLKMFEFKCHQIDSGFFLSCLGSEDPTESLHQADGKHRDLDWSSTFPTFADLFVSLFVCCYNTRKSFLRLPPWEGIKTSGSISTWAA